MISAISDFLSSLKRFLASFFGMDTRPQLPAARSERTGDFSHTVPARRAFYPETPAPSASARPEESVSASIATAPDSVEPIATLPEVVLYEPPTPHSAATSRGEDEENPFATVEDSSLDLRPDPIEPVTPSSLESFVESAGLAELSRNGNHVESVPASERAELSSDRSPTNPYQLSPQELEESDIYRLDSDAFELDADLELDSAPPSELGNVQPAIADDPMDEKMITESTVDTVIQESFQVDTVIQEPSRSLVEESVTDASLPLDSIRDPWEETQADELERNNDSQVTETSPSIDRSVDRPEAIEPNLDLNLDLNTEEEEIEIPELVSEPDVLPFAEEESFVELLPDASLDRSPELSAPELSAPELSSSNLSVPEPSTPNPAASTAMPESGSFIFGSTSEAVSSPQVEIMPPPSDLPAEPKPARYPKGTLDVDVITTEPDTPSAVAPDTGLVEPPVPEVTPAIASQSVTAEADASPAAPVPVAAPAPPEPFRVQYEVGLNHMKQRQWEQAVSAFQLAVILNPRFARGYEQLGQALQHSEDWAEAVKAFQTAIALNPNLIAAHEGLGRVHLRQHQLEDAIAAFKQGVAQDPQRFSLQLALGQALVQAQRWEDAVPAFQAAIACNPKAAQGHAGLGQALFKLGNENDAIPALQAAVDLNPKLVGIWETLGQAYLKANQLPEAVTTYRHAVTAAPKHGVFHAGLGRTLHLQQEFAQAADAYRQAAEIAPEVIWNHDGLGRALLNQGELDAAIESFRRSTELNATFAHGYEGMGRAYLLKGQADVGIPLLQRAIELNPKFLQAYVHLVTALIDRGDRDLALTYVQQGLAIAPHSKPLQRQQAQLTAVSSGNPS